VQYSGKHCFPNIIDLWMSVKTLHFRSGNRAIRSARIPSRRLGSCQEAVDHFGQAIYNRCRAAVGGRRDAPKPSRLASGTHLRPVVFADTTTPSRVGTSGESRERNEHWPRAARPFFCARRVMPRIGKPSRSKKKPPVRKAVTPRSVPGGHFASMYPGPPAAPFPFPGKSPVSPEIVKAVAAIETELKVPVWLLVQDEKEESSPRRDSFNMIGDIAVSAFFQARHGSLKKGQRVALLIDSNGGMARPAYELAMLLRRHCGGFVAVIPRHAKSAATILALGADEIIMNEHAELGPLDVQIWDPDREEQMSGLDEVQALERLQAFAMDATDRMMLLLIRRTEKKARTLIPFVTEFVTKLTKPMFQNIDVVRYTQMSRALKVGEEYGKRLLQKGYGEDRAEEISRKLVTDYPEHGFPIYPDDASNLGLNLTPVPERIKKAMERLTCCLSNQNLVGRIVGGGVS